MNRDVRIDPGVEELLPEKDRLPVLADDHRNDRLRGLGAVGQRSRVDDLEAELAKAAAQVIGGRTSGPVRYPSRPIV